MAVVFKRAPGGETEQAVREDRGDRVAGAPRAGVECVVRISRREADAAAVGPRAGGVRKPIGALVQEAVQQRPVTRRVMSAPQKRRSHRGTGQTGASDAEEEEDEWVEEEAAACGVCRKMRSRNRDGVSSNEQSSSSALEQFCLGKASLPGGVSLLESWAKAAIRSVECSFRRRPRRTLEG